MNLFTKKETNQEKELEYLVEMLIKKHIDGELSSYTILKTCQAIYKLGDKS